MFFTRNDIIMKIFGFARKICVVKMSVVSLLFLALPLWGFSQSGQAKEYLDLKEYTLDNGLSVIIHRDTTSPIVTVGTLYHVGGKNEDPERTGFAHLTEHLFFHGTKNIPEGEFERMVREVGGYSNASTSNDRTYYYLIVPSNQLEFALWLESERMLHPEISEEGFAREVEVVKEELRQRYTGSVLSNAENEMMEFVFSDHPYKMPLIGYIEHLDAAEPADFYEFTSKWYNPDNAVLVLSGDVDIEVAERWVEKYFSTIESSSAPVPRPVYDSSKEPVGKRAVVTKERLRMPHSIISYRTVPENLQDAEALKFVIHLMTDDKYGEVTALEDSCETISRIGLTPEFYEDAGMVWLRASYSCTEDELIEMVDSLFAEAAVKGFSEERIKALKSKYRNDFIDIFFSPATIAEFAATGKALYGDSYQMLNILHRVENLTDEELKAVLRKYLRSDNSDILTFIPKN